MTEPVPVIKVDELNAVARTLVRSAQSFESSPVPPQCDAGVSTGPICELMATIADATATASVSAANAADNVQVGLARYHDADHRNGQQLDDAGQNLPGTARGSTR